MSEKQIKTQPGDPLDIALCTCENIRKAARMVTQMYEGTLQKSGLKVGQITLLAVLSKKGDMPLTTLADAMVMDRTTLTRNLKPMVRDGFINIKTDEDLRVRKVGLTAKGTRKFAEAYPLWADAQSRLVEGLGVERWSNFLFDLNSTVEVARKG